MKKKLFISFLFVAVLVCFFVVSISAATLKSDYTDEITKFYDGEEEIGPDWANISDKESTVVIKKSDGTTVRVPVYYIFKAKSNNQFVANDTTNLDFGWICEKLGEEITAANVVVLEIPEGTESISGSFTNDNKVFTNLEELVIPTTVTSLGQFMFRNNIVLRRVFVKQSMNEDGTVQGVTTLPKWFADNTNNTVSALEAFDFELDYVTSIGSNAFMNSSLKSFRVTAPITNLEGTIFSGCKSLETVEINNTSDTIWMGSKAFAGCTNIKNVTLNGFSLPEYLFENANGLTGGLTFVATNVTKIGQQVFKHSTNLTSATISGDIETIGSSLFLGCTNLEYVEITNTLDTPASAGNNMCDRLENLKSVKLHGVSIGAYSFREIDGDEMVFIATNAGYIGESAFYKAGNITELYIEGPFTSIGKSTYRECPKLEKLTIINTGDTYVLIGNGESNPVLRELHIEGKIDVKDTPVFQNNISLKHVYLGNGVREIGAQAFYKCYALETMYLADTITVIGDKAIDMDAAGKQTSTSFMFVDENGNMDNTLPTSLTKIDGHFLKHFTISNTQIIFPEGFTYHNSTSAYDFEGTIYPEGFSIVYLGKMTAINLHILYQHNASKELTVYLIQNTASDIKNYRVEANVSDTGTISHGAYAGVNPNGTLEIIVDDRLHNNIVASKYIKFNFCTTNEICFVTRVNIVWGENTTKAWGNFVSTPVTYEQLVTDMEAYNNTNGENPDVVIPEKHPIVDKVGTYYAPTCTVEGGTKYFCVCGTLVRIEGVEAPTGHSNEGADITITYPLSNGAPNYFLNANREYDCVKCGETQYEEILDSALFIADKGYSYEEDGSSISYSIHVDVEAIKTYRPDFTYGIVVSANPSTSPISYVDGKITYGDKTFVFQMNDASREFSYVQAKLNNVGEKEFNCQAYAIDDGAITYIGHNDVSVVAEVMTYDAIVQKYSLDEE